MTEPLEYGPPGDDEQPQRRTAAHGPVRVRVPAKINLHLYVGPARPDGFHELVTVYQAISLYDEVTARPSDGLSLTMDGDGVAELTADDDNLVLRAARELARHTGRAPHARLHLHKQIPIAGGLAGGSADAAATLVACDALWGTGLSREELADVAAALGSDVPFLVLGGTALGTGRGEQVSPVLTGQHAWHWVVAAADGGLSTPQVYAEIDRLRAGASAPLGLDAGPPEQLLAALRQRDPAVLAKSLGNDLQPAALSLRPQLRRTLDTGLVAGALAALVSGSGPTCLFLAADPGHAAAVAAAVEPVCRSVRIAHGPVPGARIG